MKSKVLIVDDNEYIRSLIRHVLGKGYSLFEAGDGQEAIAKLSRFQFDCIISDINMPGMDGLELSRRAKESSPGVKIILMSAMGDAYRKTAFQNGAERFLSKPFKISELLKALE